MAQAARPMGVAVLAILVALAGILALVSALVLGVLRARIHVKFEDCLVYKKRLAHFE